MKKLVIADGQEPVEELLSAEEVASLVVVSRPERRTSTPLAFLERFTQEERIAIRRAARSNEELEDWLDMLRAAQEIDPEDPRTQAGMQALVEARLLSARRRDEILA